MRKHKLQFNKNLVHVIVENLKLGVLTKSLQNIYFVIITFIDK